MIRRNWFSASSIPAAVQRGRMSPDCQDFTFRCVWRTISIIDSQVFVELSVFASPESPRRVRVRVSSSPSRSERAASGQVPPSSAASSESESAQAALSRPLIAGRSPSVQLVGHVALLVALAALDLGSRSEDVANRLAKALAPSITNRIPCSGSSPRSTRTTATAVASSSLTRWLNFPSITASGAGPSTMKMFRLISHPR